MARAARLLVEHTRYYGLIIEPDCIQEIHDLIEARVKGTRPFAAFGPYSAGNQEAAEQAPIQLAAGVTLNDGTWIDATMALAAARSEPELERAGPGPKTSRSFQQQVLDLLELLDTDVAGWWRRDAGEVRSRSAKGWFAWRFNDYAAVEHGQPIIVVDETYSAAMVVEAIVRRLTQFGPFRDRFEHDWLARHHLPTAFTAVRDAHVKEMAGIAGAIAEMYISAIGSLTPSGEVIVSLGDLSRNGFRWDQLLVVLPFMAHFRKGIKLLKIKLSNGQVLGVSGDTLERLQKLPAGRRKQLIAKAQKARTEKESLAIIKRGATAPQQAPTKGKQPKQGPKARPKRGPGRWVKEHEGMPDRARA